MNIRSSSLLQTLATKTDDQPPSSAPSSVRPRSAIAGWVWGVAALGMLLLGGGMVFLQSDGAMGETDRQGASVSPEGQETVVPVP